MTLLQLKYVLTVAQTGTISDAAKELFIAQPSLTSAIEDLEIELGIEIFHRTRKGVTVTTEGEEFLSYARQVIEQTNLIEEKYFHHGPVKHQFCVSCQHYSFTAEAFIELLKNYDGDQYDFRIRETTTYEIIEDVARLRSEIGVLYLNDFNKAILKKTLRENNLKFYSLFIARPHVFLNVIIPWPPKTLSHRKTWIRIPVWLTNRERIILFIFPKQSSARAIVKKTSWSATGGLSTTVLSG